MQRLPGVEQGPEMSLSGGIPTSKSHLQAPLTRNEGCGAQISPRSMTASPGSLPLLPDSQPELSAGQGAKEESHLTHSSLKTSFRTGFLLRDGVKQLQKPAPQERAAGTGGEPGCSPFSCCSTSSHMPCNEPSISQVEGHGLTPNVPPAASPGSG